MEGECIEKLIGILDVGFIKEGLIEGQVIIVGDNLRLRGGSFASIMWNAYDRFQKLKKKRYYDKYIVDSKSPGSYPEGDYRNYYDLEYVYNPKKLKRDKYIGTGIVAAAGIAKAARRIRKRKTRPSSENTDPTGEPADNINKKMGTFIYEDIQAARKRRTRGPSVPSGYNTLNRKMSLNKMYHSNLRYCMSVVKDIDQESTSHFFTHHLNPGKGPHLYTCYNYTPADGTTRNIWFNTPEHLDVQFDSTVNNTGVGRKSTIYCFAADWPWSTMNHDLETQKTAPYHLLSWVYDYEEPTTDPNLPLAVTDFIQNADWKYIKIYGCDYIFDMTNTDIRPMCVEILLFRFKADPDSMDYQDQCLAPFAKQKYGIKEYVNQGGAMWSSPDIEIVTRKRVRLGGMQGLSHGTYLWANQINTSYQKRLKMRVRRKYVITRPIATEYADLTETEFFNTYYEPSKGVYMRIQAWPDSLAFTTQYGTTSPYQETKVQSAPETLNVPDAQVEMTKIGNGVDVRVYKKGYFKFDEVRLKSLSTNGGVTPP